MNIEFNSSNNKLNFYGHETNKGIIILGTNGKGKTEILKNTLKKIEVSGLNPIFFEVCSIENMYENELDLKPEDSGEDILEKAFDNSNDNFFKFLNNSENMRMLLDKIRTILKLDIILDFKSKELKYSNGKKITSVGHKKMIYLCILSLYYVSKKNKKLLLIDEPNTNLDDDNSENIIPYIEEFLSDVTSDYFIIATSNLVNIVQCLEGYLIFNLITKELCYSDDLFGNPEAIKRIGEFYKSQQSFVSKVKEELNNILLNNLNFHIQEEKYFILTEKTPKIVLYIENFTPIEKSIYNNIITSRVLIPSSHQYTICHITKTAVLL